MFFKLQIRNNSNNFALALDCACYADYPYIVQPTAIAVGFYYYCGTIGSRPL